MNLGNYFLATCMVVSGGLIALQTVICNPTPFVFAGVGCGLVFWGFRIVRPQARPNRRRP